MPATPNYADLVAKAEVAVAGVKDPELKRVAFQKVLDDLLATTSAKLPRRESRLSAAGMPKKTKKRYAGPQGRVEELADEGFFKKPKTIAQVKAELENRGHHIPLTSLSGPLQKLTQKRILRRQRVKTSGKKETYAYSDW